MNQFAVFVLVLCTLGPLVSAFPTGAPAAACVTLSPNPTMHGAESQAVVSVPYYVNFTNLVPLNAGVYGYMPGETYTMSLTVREDAPVGTMFRGLLVQARQVSDDTQLLGDFGVLDNVQTQLSSCARPNSAITHTSNVEKETVYFSWTAPEPGYGAIRFRWAAVQVRVTYWADIASTNVYELNSEGMPVNVPPTTVAATVATTAGAATLGAGSLVLLVSALFGALM